MDFNSETVVALGNFDGLHSGHMRVISSAVEAGREKGSRAIALVFSQHPAYILCGEAPKSIMTNDEKARKISEAGAECIFIDFKEVMELTPKDFVNEILVKKYNARTVCCGFNYRFGKNAEGDAQKLRELCGDKGIDVIISSEVNYRGKPVSSSRIRECILSGSMREAENMLGCPFSYSFEVVDGDKIGRTLGAPTINQLFPEDFILPLSGVYASKTELDGKVYDSVTNVGKRPTLNGESLRSETFILGYSGNLYGKMVRVSLLRYIRSERRFSSLTELREQIEFDAGLVKSGIDFYEKMRVKAVFFDFDDTLQSRKGAYRLYCEAFLEKYFPDIDPKEKEQKLFDMEEYVDGGYKDREEYFPELIDLWKWEEHPPMQELYDSFNIDYGKYTVMLPYAIDVLEEIKQRGYTMGIISNGVSVLQNTKLDTAGIRDMFDIVVVSGDFGVYKPDRRIFDEACRQTGFDNTECLFVGDHPVNDIKGALGADMKAVRMNQGDFYNMKLDSRIPTIEDLRELLKLI